MSFKVIEGGNVVKIFDANSKLELLEQAVSKNLQPTNQELVIYAFQFITHGQLLRAQQILNKVSAGYFDMTIYKELYFAQTAYFDKDTNLESAKRYEFIPIINRCLDLFDEITFVEKPAFYRFRREFQRANRKV